MPRLFTYGGTRFSERKRLGIWALNSIEPFNDSTGVPEIGFSVGMLWDSGGAALLLRQQQKDSTGRSNTFTLLLDPEDAVWEQFGWNAAALALALFGEDGKTDDGGLLLSRPEEVTAETLATLLAQVHKATITREENPCFSSLWTGTVAEQDLLVAPFPAAGWESAPTLAMLASRLASLPVCFRAGLSFLVGGNRPQARSLNIRLVLNRFETDPLPPALAEHGARLLEAWTIAAGVSADLAALDVQPVMRWNMEPGVAFERAVLLAAFSSGRPEAESALPGLLKTLDAPGPAAADLRRVALRFALSGNGRMSAARTRFALKLSEEIERDQTLTLGERLDGEATIAHFAAETGRPLPATWSLPILWRSRIWRERLKRAPGVAGVAPILEAALRDLPKEEHAEILQRTIADSLSRSFLYEWLPFFAKNPDCEAKVVDFLQERARTEVLKGTAERALGYLAFGNDPGGRLLAGRDLKQNDIASFIETLNAEAGGKGARAELARAWLKAMAASPFRRRVGLAEKLLAAHESGPSRGRAGDWRWLRKLEQLYHGKKPRFFLEMVPAEERDFLREEFVEMLAHPPEHGVPQLTEIKRLLDGIPGQSVRLLSELGIPERQAERWAERLRESGLPAVAEKYLARVALRAKGHETRRDALGQADEGALTEAITQLLREVCERGSPASAERFAEFLDSVRGDELLRKKAGAVLSAVWKSTDAADARARDWILRCLANDAALYIEFAAGLEKRAQLNLLERLEELAPQAIRVESVGAARKLADGGKEMNSRVHALLRYMHSRAGAQLRRVAGDDGYKGGAKAFDRRLCELYGSERSASAKVDEDRLGLMGKLLSPFQRHAK